MKSVNLDREIDLREAMGSRKMRFLCISMTVFFASVVGASGARLGREGFFFGLIDSMPATPLKLDARKVWLNCMDNSMESVEVFRTSSSLLDDLVQNPVKSGLFPGGKMLSDNSAASAVKHAFLRRLISKGSNHFPRYNYVLRNVQSECSGHPVLRRHLAHLTLHHAASPAVASGVVVASTSTPVQALKVELPDPTPAPISDIAPMRSSSADRHSTPLPIDFGLTNTDTNNSDCVPTSVKEENSEERTDTVSSVSNTTGTFFLAACVFCFYKRYPREKNDPTCVSSQRPLVNLRFRNFFGMSRKCFGTGSLIRKGPLSFIIPRRQKGHTQSLDSSSDGTSLSDTHSEHSSPVNAREPKALPLPQPSSVVPCPMFEPPPRFVSSPASFATLTPPPSPSSLTSPSFPEQMPAVVSSPDSPLLSPPPPATLPSISKTFPLASVPSPPLPSKNSGPKPPPPPPKVAIGQGGSISSVQQTSLCEPNYSGKFGSEAYNGATKTKLKPFFWDKVLDNTGQSIVWQNIRSGSFRFDEKLIERLFGYNSTRKSNEVVKELSSSDTPTRCIHLLDHKKSQNLSISLKALNVKTEEVCDALVEGNELPVELLQALLRLQPTTDEELKLRLYSGDLSLLSPAEQFLKVLVDIPFAFKRIDALLFISSLHEDVSRIKDAFATLEEACIELKSKRLFLKLLEAVLKTGNRMNDGTLRGGAQAFKLDTLLKLSDVKGSDGKTTLLHFVVQEIIKSEGQRAVRLARENKSLSDLVKFNSEEFSVNFPMEDENYHRNLGLEIVSGLSGELQNVKKAAGIDMDSLTTTIAGFGHKLLKTKEFLDTDMNILGEYSGFHHLLKYFIEHAGTAMTILKKEENRISMLLQKTTDSFHGNTGKDEGLRLFVIVRDFLGMLDKACKEVKEAQNKVSHAHKLSSNSSAANSPDIGQPLF